MVCNKYIVNGVRHALMPIKCFRKKCNFPGFEHQQFLCFSPSTLFIASEKRYLLAPMDKDKYYWMIALQESSERAWFGGGGGKVWVPT